MINNGASLNGSADHLLDEILAKIDELLEGIVKEQRADLQKKCRVPTRMEEFAKETNGLCTKTIVEPEPATPHQKKKTA